jgi:hypothetical protein
MRSARVKLDQPQNFGAPMPGFKYLPPGEKKMFMVVTLGIASMGLGVAADALPELGFLLYPLAGICAAGFVAAFVGPTEKLFPLTTLPRRASPVIWSWCVYILQALLFFGGIAAIFYLVVRGVRMLQ